MTKDEIPPSAFIKHHLPGRVRLKIPQKRGNINYFDRLADLFSECIGITELKLNPSVASVLICHRPDLPFQNIVEFAKTQGLFTLTEKPEDHEAIVIPNLPITTLAWAGLDQVDDSLLDFSQGRLNVRSLVFLSLVGLAIYQIKRGSIMAPAASLLWYAFGLVNAESEDLNELENIANSMNE